MSEPEISETNFVSNLYTKKHLDTCLSKKLTILYFGTGGVLEN
jgi:hypothetical protein